MPSFLKLRTSAFICEEKSDHLCADHPAACAGCAIFLSHLRPWSGSHVHDLSLDGEDVRIRRWRRHGLV